jgi:hypothetical protein
MPERASRARRERVFFIFFSIRLWVVENRENNMV